MVVKYFNAFRVKEIVPKLGFVFIGCVFALQEIVLGAIFVELVVLAVICLLGGVSIYAFNAYFGWNQDSDNTRLVSLRMIRNKSLYLYLGITLLVLSISCAWYLNQNIFYPAVIIFFLWIIYVNPLIAIKGIPSFGILLAIVAQVFHFHLGYLAFSNFNTSSFLISLFYAFLFGAGHLWHEIIDHDSDRMAGLNTTAVYLNVRNAKRVFFFIFIGAHLYLGGLFAVEVISAIMFVPYLISVLLVVIYWKLDASIDLFSFRRFYMIVYFLATSIFIVVRYWM